MLSGELLVEVRDVEVEVALAVEPEYLIECGRWHPPRARPAAPAVEEGVEAELLVLLLPAAHVTGRDAENLCRLYPGDLLGRGAQDDFLNFHGPLHGGLRVVSHGLN